MKIAKNFYWEMGHRLPNHSGACRNLHGHSYKMRVELEGTPDSNGMLIDYFILSNIVNEIIAPFDHSFLCEQTDKLMCDFLQANNFKCVIVPFISTAENIAVYFLELIKKELEKRNYNNIKNICIRIYETSDVFAEAST